MNLACFSTAARSLALLGAMLALASPLAAQTPAARPNGRTSPSFAPSAPGQGVVYRPAGENVIQVATKPGSPTLADRATANRNAQMAQARGRSGSVLPASTTRMMQDPVEEVPPPTTERSVVVPSHNGVVMEEIPPGAQILQGPYIDGGSGHIIGDHYSQPFFSTGHEGVVMEGGVVMQNGLPAAGCSDCDGGCSGGCYGPYDGLRVLRPCADGCLIPCPRISVDNTQVFVGAEGFTGVANRGETGSFGFHEGVNVGGPFPFLPVLDLSMQFGVMGTQSTNSGASFTPYARDQLFTTLGIFHRVDWGFQGGVVVDYMHDEWYYNLDIYQVRGELSWVNPNGHEVGAWFTTADNLQITQSQIVVDNRVVDFEQRWEVTDVYAFFYRRRFCETNATARIYGGFTENGDGIVGADAMAPLSDAFALSGAFTYLIPNSDDSNQIPSYQRESWNVQFSLVWFPGAGARKWTYHRPLMNVANNGTFFLQNP